MKRGVIAMDWKYIDVFISQPMHGKSRMEIEVDRERITKIVKSRYPNSYIVDSIMPEKEGFPPLYYLSKSIEMLSHCDMAFFSKGWENERGCVIEHMCAVHYGYKTDYEE